MIGLVAVAVVVAVLAGGRSRQVRRLDRTTGPDLVQRSQRWVETFKEKLPRHVDKKRAAAVELVNGFVSELRAGQPIRQAFIHAHDSCDVAIAREAVATARLGGDVPKALRAAGEQPGLDVLRSLAALWTVAEGSGAGLAEAADRLATSSAAAQAARREVRSQLASPKATARVLAGLPIFGLLMGMGLGASPVEWLLSSIWGLLVLFAGISLEITGLWWISRLTRSVEALI